MARHKLYLPDNFSFTTELSVRITDINYGGHLGNDSLLSLVHEARQRFLLSHGFSEGDVDGAFIVMIDAVVNYKTEGHYGDKLKVDVAVDDVTKRGCDFYFLLTNTETGKEVARAKTGIAFVDPVTRKLAHTPQAFMDAVN